MSIATLNRQADGCARLSLPTTFFAAAADPLPALAPRPAPLSSQDLVRFALAWARSEPAFVAQQHREWFS